MGWREYGVGAVGFFYRGSAGAVGTERQMAQSRQTTDGMGDHKQIYMQSSLDNAGSQGNGGHRGEGSPHLQGGRAMVDD